MGKKQKITINYHSCELVVEGKYIPYHPGTYHTPSEPAEFEIYKIFVENEETDIFNEDVIDISILCVEAIENSNDLENEFNKFL